MASSLDDYLEAAKDEQQVYVIGNGCVVHLTSSCPVIRKAHSYSQRTVLQVKQLAENPRVCKPCIALVKRLTDRRRR